ncbi:MAG: LytTR family DNA-binding domain-containing protein [Candidatus Pseudobacter hemicellulosilyticus]|uniref:LytTR family DNA-binding domain-containing protein n=1 Tax=Candidatus Pseudobacter hemicellulosilyticus TaxID=3121375 RepID=A0AAJ5WTV2_9BACT|nr:MAG: LytTR family DNA-binding domain-containing protein [Pseudobacter sp.]
MHIIIISEDASATSSLRALVKKTIPEITEVRVTTDFSKVSDLIRSFKPSILFIDAAIIPRAGYDMFKKLPEDIRARLVIFTQPDEQVVNAIRFSMVEFITQPFIGEALRASFDRLTAQPANMPAAQTMYSNLLRNVTAKNTSDLRLTLTSGEGTFFYHIDDIIRLESDPPFTWFYFTNRKPLPIPQALKVFEELLIQQGFLPVHKSYLINKTHVLEFTAHGTITLSDRTQVEISRRRKEEMLKALESR